MRIGIDARVLDKGMTGTGRYLLNLLNEIPNQDSKNEYFLITNSNFGKDSKFYKIIRYRKSILPFKVYSQLYLNYELPRLLKNYKIDVLFSPNILVPLVNLGKTKILSVVHDVIPKVYPEYYSIMYRVYLSVFLPFSLKKADRIITVSEFSKKDIIQYYNVNSDKIDVVYNTASKIFQPKILEEEELSILKNKYHLPDKYLLYVGAIQKRKNILGLIEIFDIIRNQGSDIKLVMIGKPDYDFKNILPEIEKRKNIITYIRFAEDDDLVKLYNSAFAFIFPSYYEGFGIPPLEAMQTGIPVLSSKTSSLSEVVGEGGLLYNPEDYNAFVNDILELENNQDFYNQQKTKSLKQSKKFDISEITSKLVDIFNTI